MNFTAHNILLSNGQKTMGDQQILLNESAEWAAIKKSLDFFYPGSKEERSRIRVVDLGCLEGGYAVEFAKMGFDTVGIEARQENVDNCNMVKESLGLTNLTFVRDDVRNLPQYKQFDIAFCYGLLYHLNDPANFLNIMGQCTSKMLLLNTHFAPEFDIRYKLGPINTYFLAPLQKRMPFLANHKNFRLSGITTNEGYKGRWYNEWSKNEKKAKVEKMLWAAYNNHQAFWLTKKELTKAIHNAGFNSVFEQFDYTGDRIPENYTEYYKRTMFVGIKHS